MEFLRIGNSQVPISVRPNRKLKGRRLSVSPSGVLVEAPEGLLGTIDLFLEAKAQWIFAEWQKHKDVIKLSPWPEEFTSGAKVLFLGRFTPMTVSEGGRELAVRECGDNFEVTCPSGLARDQRYSAIRFGFEDFFSEALSIMALQFGKTYGFDDLNITVNQRKDRWAYCRQDGAIFLGWDLIFLPKPVIEYVIVHELVHKSERHHGEDFWNTLSVHLPDWREREAALRECEKRFDFNPGLWR